MKIKGVLMKVIQKFLIKIAINHPKKVMIAAVLITAFFLSAFPKIKTDTDPVKMLPQG
jgi:predicted RND superfamily exporter protein